MLDSIRSFFQRTMSAEREGSAPHVDAPRGGPSQLQVAAAALLLELVHADDEFSQEERAHLEASLGHYFAQDEETVSELIALAEAERRAAVDLYQFTRLIRESYDLGQKTVLAEVMWGIILADGRIVDREAHLLRKIGKLLDLKPGYLAEARKRARVRPDGE